MSTPSRGEENAHRGSNAVEAEAPDESTVFDVEADRRAQIYRWNPTTRKCEEFKDANGKILATFYAGSKTQVTAGKVDLQGSDRLVVDEIAYVANNLDKKDFLVVRDYEELKARMKDKNEKDKPFCIRKRFLEYISKGRYSEKVGWTKPQNHPTPPKSAQVGDRFNLKNPIRVIEIEEPHAVKNLGQVEIEVLENTQEAAYDRCRLKANPLPKFPQGPCRSAQLIVAEADLYTNQGQCFCAKNESLAGLTRLNELDRVLPSKHDEDEEHDNDNEEENNIPEVSVPLAKTIAASGKKLYRPNGLPASDFDNLSAEIIQKAPITKDKANGIYLVRLWKKKDDGTLEPFNQRAVYGLEMAHDLAQQNLPQTETSPALFPQVFRKVIEAAKEKQSGVHIDPNQAPSEKQKSLIAAAKKGSLGGSAGFCSTYVKKYIAKAYGIKYQFCDAYEIDLTYDLEDLGFQKIDTRNPYKAPAGCIILYDSFARIGSYRSRPKGRDASEMRVNFPKFWGGKPIDRDKYVPSWGHVEVATGDKTYPFISDFKQKNSVISNDKKSDLSNGWGFNKSMTREYKVIGIYCKR